MRCGGLACVKGRWGRAPVCCTPVRIRFYDLRAQIWVYGLRAQIWVYGLRAQIWVYGLRAQIWVYGLRAQIWVYGLRVHIRVYGLPFPRGPTERGSWPDAPRRRLNSRQSRECPGEEEGVSHIQNRREVGSGHTHTVEGGRVGAERW
jgi:hypothetical protein